MRKTQSNLMSNALIADVANIAQATTDTPAANNINTLCVEGSEYVDILMKVTGESGADGVVSFNWILYNSASEVPTVPSRVTTVTMSSDTPIKSNYNGALFVGGYRWMRLLSIGNADVAKDATAVNAFVSSLG